MNKPTSNIIKLIHSGITNKSFDIPKSADYKTILTDVKRHRCVTMLYYGLKNNNIILESELNVDIENTVRREIAQSELQLYCIKELREIFNSAGIEHIFLKGSVLKQLYPYPEIRRMGDIDVLIKLTQYEKISEVMLKAGYVFKYESTHEIVWRKKSVKIELHKTLIPSYNEDLHSYFGDGWKRAIPENENTYTFSNEDMFIYIFSHFAKHYRDSGIGIIHMCDLYVFLNSFELDFEYINKELVNLRLYDFWINIKATIDAWFSDGKSTDLTDYITEVIFGSGVYGLKEKSNASKALKSRNKYKHLSIGKSVRLFSFIFPSYFDMKRKYPALIRFPFLLPIFWIWRWISAIFVQRKNIKGRVDNICMVSDEQVTEYQKSLNYVGLDYNF